jgi:CDP-paratose 2-epimerase
LSEPPPGHVLITGGAGFIGTNLADRFARDGTRVVVLDNLARAGVEENLEWLLHEHGSLVRPVIADIRDGAAVRTALKGATAVFHLAAQVAVTTSLEDPLDDFDINLGATVALLDQVRQRPVPFLFTSTNKVYGSLSDIPLERFGRRWLPSDPEVRARGISESRPLGFCTPYGCSKGGADQYVLDYAETFGIPAVVFRMSCIYGPHQHGNEDQGWVAHFLLRAAEGERVTVYGDGAQVRDLLFASDLVDAMMLALEQAEELAGGAFNIGGGPANTISLLELLDLIAQLQESQPEVEHGDERAGDQRWYVSDTSRFQTATGWSPRVGAEAGIERLYEWLAGHRSPNVGLAKSAAT